MTIVLLPLPLESLEKRLAKLEEAFRRLLPNVNLEEILTDESDEREHIFISTGGSNGVTRNDDPVFHLRHEINTLIWPLSANGFFGKSCSSLLHRPTFQQAIDSGLHLLDHLFGGPVLLVCALGARFSDDPRVASTASTVKGWDWYVQVDVLRTLEEARACLDTFVSLVECSLYADCKLSHLHLATPWAWTSACYNAGAHVFRDLPPNARDELWKRAFGSGHILLDMSMATLVGRPLAIRYDDFDVDYPIECDDEYWSDAIDPTLNFSSNPKESLRLLPTL
ncbi:hypothetical protein CPB85DRAFT_1433889 [Mucidula mucida]|nr:hypothetical protein CPB85DRAFT_1433889 [Mucidula mucida]